MSQRRARVHFDSSRTGRVSPSSPILAHVTTPHRSPASPRRRVVPAPHITMSRPDRACAVRLAADPQHRPKNQLPVHIKGTFAIPGSTPATLGGGTFPESPSDVQTNLFILALVR